MDAERRIYEITTTILENMKEQTIIIEKNEDGSYSVALKTNFVNIIKMAFSGFVKMRLDANQAQALSKALYVPVKRDYQPRKRPATSVNK